jgi:hypothetical protein
LQGFSNETASKPSFALSADNPFAPPADNSEPIGWRENIDRRSALSIKTSCQNQPELFLAGTLGGLFAAAAALAVPDGFPAFFAWAASATLTHNPPFLS